MKTTLPMSLVTGSIAVLMILPLWGNDAVPKLINYQGKLTDAAGIALPDGTYGLRFELFTKADASQPGDKLVWGEDREVFVAGGVFNVALGGATTGDVFPGAAVIDLAFAFGSSDRYLQTSVLSGPLLSLDYPLTVVPRQQFASVPYAVTALHGVPSGTIVSWVGLGQGLSLVPDGWIEANGQSIGNANSGAHVTGEIVRNLYRLLWNSIGNESLPIQDGTGAETSRGSSADDDFAEGKRMRVPDLRGRTAIGAGRGPGLSTRILGSTTGTEAHRLTIAEIPAHHHPITDRPHRHEFAWSTTGGGRGNSFMAENDHTDSWYKNARKGLNTPAYTGITRTENVGGSAPHNLMQPSIALNYLLKL